MTPHGEDPDLVLTLSEDELKSFKRQIYLQTAGVVLLIALGMVACYASGIQVVQGLGTFVVIVVGLRVNVSLTRRRLERVSEALSMPGTSIRESTDER